MTGGRRCCPCYGRDSKTHRDGKGGSTWCSIESHIWTRPEELPVLVSDRGVFWADMQSPWGKGRLGMVPEQQSREGTVVGMQGDKLWRGWRVRGGPPAPL